MPGSGPVPACDVMRRLFPFDAMPPLNPHSSQPPRPRMPLTAFVATFKVSERELHLLRDGLIADQHGVDPEAAYRLLQQLRR